MTVTLKASDTDLEHAVARELQWTAGVDSAAIEVAVTDSRVTLSGPVGSYPEKLLAESAASNVRGVTALIGELSVREAPGAITDVELADRATEALRWTVQVPSGVEVSVRANSLVLSGVVQWQYEREAAVRAVQYLTGVQNVENELTIGRSVLMADTRTDVMEALCRNADIQGERITVTTEAGGLVILDGMLNSSAEVARAEAVAWSAPGVNAIANYISVIA